jgi:predicted GNAT family N-acyltransferase
MPEYSKYVSYKSEHCFLLISNEKKTIRVIDVVANNRGRGHGTGLMGLVCEFGDELQMRLVLRARPYGHDASLDQQQLEAFYAKFGFEHTVKGEMIRPLRS